MRARESADATGVHAICGLRWDLAKVYPRHGRGEHCTSADGAGFPIAPLLFNADEVWAAAQAHGDRLLISVRDEGAGLSEAEKATIFGRFVRGERLSATTSGSGLGLWIASAFVTANGGKLKAVSDGPGLGATLTVELPVTQTAVPQLESDADE